MLWLQNLVNYFTKEDNRDKSVSKIVHYSAYAFSAFMDANLFHLFATDQLGQWFFGGWGIIWTSLKIVILKRYLVVRSERKELTKEKRKGMSRGVLLLAGYLLFAGVSYWATLGFVQINILGQTQTATVRVETTNNVETTVTGIKTKIEQGNSSITGWQADKNAKTTQYNKNGAYNAVRDQAYTEAQDALDKKISDMQNQIEGWNKNLTEVQNQKTEVSKKETVALTTMFDALASTVPFNQVTRADGSKEFKMTGLNIQFILGNLIALAVEVALWVTTNVIRRRILKVRESKTQFYIYINSLFNVRGAALTPDRIISERTGISMIDCKRYRDILLNNEFEGTPLIRSIQGGATANFSKDLTLGVVDRLDILE